MNNDLNSANCRHAQNQIAAYIGNDLSARETFDLERHLTDCSDCARQAEEMRMTVSLLGSMERRDTSHDFMASLHAKLDNVEPAPLRMRDRVAGLVAAIRDMRLQVAAPAFGLGAAVVMIGVMSRTAPTTQNAVQKPSPNMQKTATAAAPVAAEALHRNVALSSNSLFEDPAAANLEAHAPADDSNEASDSPSL